VLKTAIFSRVRVHEKKTGEYFIEQREEGRGKRKEMEI
jgi:hypothetical protein